MYIKKNPYDLLGLRGTHPTLALYDNNMKVLTPPGYAARLFPIPVANAPMEGNEHRLPVAA